MDPWVLLVTSLSASVVGGVVKLVAFTVECRLRRDLEQRSVALLEQAQLTGDAHDVSVMGRALARAITARGPLPVFRLQPAAAIAAAKHLLKPDQPASVPTPGGGASSR